MGTDLHYILCCEGTRSLHYSHQDLFHSFPVRRVNYMTIMNGMGSYFCQRGCAAEQRCNLRYSLRSAHADNRNSALAQCRRYGSNGVTKHAVSHLDIVFNVECESINSYLLKKAMTPYIGQGVIAAIFISTSML
ncbi:hypothetical protein D3C75_909190 [compost metagenome]